MLEETQTYQVISDPKGVIYRQRKHHQTIPQYIRFPVENEADYDKLLPRLNGKDAGRYLEDFADDLRRRYERGEIIGISFQSFFGFLRELMGFENVCLAFCDRPQLIRRMIADRVQFAKDLFARLLATGQLNFVQIWEDMAYKAGPRVSPRMVREFMQPTLRIIVCEKEQYKGMKCRIEIENFSGTSIWPVSTLRNQRNRRVNRSRSSRVPGCSRERQGRWL